MTAPRGELPGLGAVWSSRATVVLPVAATVVALLGTGVADAGTTVTKRADYRPAIDGTSLTRIAIEGRVEPFHPPSRMAQVLALAPLSLRTWAAVFGVTHTAIGHWKDGQEPDREQLDRVLGALREAASHHSDLATWLKMPVPGTDVRPLDLLRDERWTAFRGAIRARSGPTVDLPAEELVRRRRAQLSWAVPDVPIVVE